MVVQAPPPPNMELAHPTAHHHHIIRKSTAFSLSKIIICETQLATLEIYFAPSLPRQLFSLGLPLLVRSIQRRAGYFRVANSEGGYWTDIPDTCIKCLFQASSNFLLTGQVSLCMRKVVWGVGACFVCVFF